MNLIKNIEKDIELLTVVHSDFCSEELYDEATEVHEDLIELYKALKVIDKYM